MSITTATIPVADWLAGDTPEVYARIPCPIRAWICEHARNLGEICDGFSDHKLDYCEACGQTEAAGYRRFRRAA